MVYRSKLSLSERSEWSFQRSDLLANEVSALSAKRSDNEHSERSY